MAKQSKTVFFDVETYSETDINDGAYAYSHDPSFEICILGWAINDEPVQYLDEPEENIAKLSEWFNDPEVTMVAHNLNMFDRTVIYTVLGSHPKCTWYDTVEAARISQEPKLSLDALATKYGSEKLAVGKELIRLFAMPVKLSKKLAEQLGREDEAGTMVKLGKADLPYEWGQYIKYLKQDVVALREVALKLPVMNDFERAVSEVTFDINWHGSRINFPMVDAILALEAKNNDVEMPINTGSSKQMIEYAKEYGVTLENVQADYLKKMIKTDLPPEVRKVVEYRVLSNLSALKKLKTFKKVVVDGYIHDYLVYSGASASGRFSGKGPQLQNLSHDAPKTSYADYAKQLKAGTLTNPELSALVRPTIMPDEGQQLVILDFKNIEARVMYYFAHDEHMIQAFRDGLDPYKVTATKMYDVDYDHVSKAQRKDAKTASLALGYGGGVAALAAFGYDGDNPQGVVDSWRKANKSIMVVWDFLMDRAVKQYRLTHGDITVPLPSGRVITIHKEELKMSSKGKPELIVTQGTKTYYKSIYGGMLFNRLVQGFARDIMAQAMVRIADAGYTIINSVHDEVIVTTPRNRAQDDIQKIRDLMVNHSYGELLVLDVDGEISNYYRK